MNFCEYPGGPGGPKYAVALRCTERQGGRLTFPNAELHTVRKGAARINKIRCGNLRRFAVAKSERRMNTGRCRMRKRQARARVGRDRTTAHPGLLTAPGIHGDLSVDDACKMTYRFIEPQSLETCAGRRGGLATCRCLRCGADVVPLPPHRVRILRRHRKRLWSCLEAGNRGVHDRWVEAWSPM